MANKTRTICLDLNETVVHQRAGTDELSVVVFEALTAYVPRVSLETFQEVYEQNNKERDEQYREGRQLLQSGHIDAARAKLVEPRYSQNIGTILMKLGRVPSPAVVQGVNSIFQQRWLEGLTLPPGNQAALEWLKRKGYRLGIITNFQQPDLVPQILNKFGLLHLFDEVIVSATIGLRKPHPDLFRLALERLGISSTSEKAIFVGDDLEEDILGARFAGMRPILMDPRARYVGSTLVDTRIERLDQMLDLLDLPIAT